MVNPKRGTEKYVLLAQVLVFVQFFLECYLFFSYNLSIKNVFCIVYVYTWQDDAYVKIMPNQFRLTKHNGLTMTFSNGYNEIHL